MSLRKVVGPHRTNIKNRREAHFLSMADLSDVDSVLTAPIEMAKQVDFVRSDRKGSAASRLPTEVIEQYVGTSNNL